jgi:hypothetical protein
MSTEKLNTYTYKQSANNAAQEQSLRQADLLNSPLNQQQAVPAPTEDQRDLSAAHGTLSALLIAAENAPSKQQIEDLLIGGIAGVILSLEKRLQFRSSRADILRAAAYLVDGKGL